MLLMKMFALLNNNYVVLEVPQRGAALPRREGY